MLIKETGNHELPTIILLHGGGLSDWSWEQVTKELQEHYQIITPIIDGHGEDAIEEFVSIQDSANKLIQYIDKQHNGKVFAIAGLSIGAQILTEVISQRKDITKYAIIESALLYPIKGTTTLIIPAYQLLYGLIKKRWFSHMQAKTLCIPPDKFETYYQDSVLMSKKTLINISLSNGNYLLKDRISMTNAKVLIIVGSKELSIMKKSSYLLHERIKDSELFIAQSMKHGEISLIHSKQYTNLLKSLFTK